MTQGIHHITAIASDGRKTIEFYTKILGLRLVKKTVNQDDVKTYHLFFGDTQGHPGMDLTFFIFQPTTQGRSGTGMVTTVSFSIPETAIDFWKKRLHELSLPFTATERFGFERIVFHDPDGLELELVGDSRPDDHDVWVVPGIGKENAIRCFYGVTLTVSSSEAIKPILTNIFDYQFVQRVDRYSLFEVAEHSRAAALEIKEEVSSLPLPGAGTVHHIAFRAKDDEEQLSMRQEVEDMGLYATEVINRFYFQSVYFRTPSGILFEIATNEPGFTADESLEALGTHLSLPPFLESQRQAIEAGLVEL